MPIAVTEAPYRPVPLDPPRKSWTRVEYHALETAGLFDQQRLELIEGQLINKMGKKRRHINAHTLLLAWLVRVFGEAFVNSEAPIDVGPEDNPSNEPEPDLIVLALPTWQFQSNPAPGDLRLVVEVSDSTLGFDLTAKAALYARAGIPEYWVLDVAARRLVVHRSAKAGRYTDVAAYGEDETVAALAAPEAEFRIGDAFRS